MRITVDHCSVQYISIKENEILLIHEWRKIDYAEVDMEIYVQKKTTFKMKRGDQQITTI